jgi:two-component system LytT family response regulator
MEKHKFTAVIIDDMSDAREALKDELDTHCPEIKLLGEAESVVSGSKLLKTIKPDIVFLDIELQDGTGFDILEIIGEYSFKVIFTTASDEFAIKAFRFSALDYLMKPVDPDELIEAIQKLDGLEEKGEEQLEVLMHSLNQKKAPEKIALHTLDKIQLVAIKDIISCKADGNYTIFHFAEGGNLLVTKTLKEFDEMLKDHAFLRTHQSHLVNMNQVLEYVKTEGGYLKMSNKSEVPVSFRKRAEVIKRLSNL